MNPAAFQEIVTERLIHAPRELVFAAWTDPAQVAQWWGPDGFTNTIHEMDVRPGGLWRFVMHGPDGTDYQNRIIFVEIVEPELIVYDHVSTPKFRSTVTFVDEGGRTRLTMRARFEDDHGYEMAVKTFGAVEGARQTIGRLASIVESGGVSPVKSLEPGSASDPAPGSAQAAPSFVIARKLKAPRSLVWKVWSDPAHFARWWGPVGCVVDVKAMEFRTGGMAHYSMTYPGQPSQWGRFVFGRIQAEDMIEFVNSFSDESGRVIRAPFLDTWPLEWLNVVTFTEDRGVTTMTLRATPINSNHREHAAFVGHGASMNEGFGATFDNLATYLAGLQGQTLQR